VHLSEQPLSLVELSETQREQAMARFAVLRPHLELGVPLPRAAREAGVTRRTAQRWLARYRADGLAGLARLARKDLGRRQVAAEVVECIEGLFLQKPRPSVAAVRRRLLKVAAGRRWTVPSYSSIYQIIRRLDPGMVTLAHEGHAAYRDQFELIYRHRAERPNAMWQVDHTQLDLKILDSSGRAARPWLTTVIDDHSRAIAGYTAFVDAPSSLQTALALRQAIWRKTDSQWPVCGIPDVIYVDHGSDFTSRHLEQVAADLRFEIIFSTVARPQGRGKIERLFQTINTELLLELPGYLVGSRCVTPPRLSLSELDRALGEHLVGIYNTREHGEIGLAPQTAWLGAGWLPRMPESLEELDLLLLTVAKSRTVHRDGIHFQGLRYLAPTLAAYVGESVTLRYDPRDLGEVRVFHRNRFVCRAVSDACAGEALTLKDIQAARLARRRALRDQIRERVVPVSEFLPKNRDRQPSLSESSTPARAVPRLRLYREDLK
jgi:putative transposase